MKHHNFKPNHTGLSTSWKGTEGICLTCGKSKSEHFKNKGKNNEKILVAKS